MTSTKSRAQTPNTVGCRSESTQGGRLRDEYKSINPTFKIRTVLVSRGPTKQLVVGVARGRGRCQASRYGPKSQTLILQP